jgi:hypothetical protein
MHPPPIGVRRDHRQRTHHLELLGEPVDRPRLDRAMQAGVDLHEPCVELVLEVALVGDHGGPA